MIEQPCEYLSPGVLHPCIIRLCISEPGTGEPYYQQEETLKPDDSEPDLSAQETLDSSCKIPSHPLFKYVEGQADLYQCRDAIDHVAALIELCNSLDLDGETCGGLSSRAATGYYWVSTLALDTLDYTRDRMIELNSGQQAQNTLLTECLSTLFKSLQTLNNKERERVLQQVAIQMGLSESQLDKLIKTGR